MNTTAHPVEKTQGKLHSVVNEALTLNAEGRPEVQQYQSVVSMVYTLVEDGRLEDLYQTIKAAFPEYYN